MKTPRFLIFGLLVTCATVTTQCALYQNWRPAPAPEEPPQFSNSLPSPQEVFVYQPPQYVSRMPVVVPVAGTLMSERTYEFGGRKYLEQRILLSEFPLETELRVTQIP